MSARSKWGSVLLALALAAGGCGGDDGGDGGDGAEPESRAGRTLWIMGFGPGDEIANVRAAEATKALAPAKVRNPRGAFDDQKFLATVAAGNPPDLVYVDRQKVGTLAARGALMPLTSCIEEQGVDTSVFLDAAIEEVTFDGDVYALPEFTSQRTLIVVDDVVAEAGLEPEDVSTTDWDRLREITKKLVKIEGGRVTRIGFDPKIPEFFPLWAKANGVDLLSEDGKTANLDDPKAVEALEYTASLIRDQGGWNRFKAFRDTWDFFGSKNQVAEGQIGAWPMESWYWNVIAETSPNAGVTAVPFTDRNGDPITFLSGNGWAIPTGAKNPDLACLWAKTMTQTETWVKAAEARAKADRAENKPFTGLYTANKVADKEIVDTVYEPVKPNFDEAVELLVDVQEDAFALPASPAGAEFNQAMQDAINRVLVGRQTPAQALAQAQKEAQTALDENAN